MYTTHGSICGPCGHKHATLIAAEKCRRAHSNAVRRYNGPNSYSDRDVVRVDEDGEYERLTDNEAEALLEYQESVDVR